MPHWHHILDDPALTEHEKIVALSALRLNGECLGTAPNGVIASMCKISERQVQRCKKSLKKIGTLAERVVRGKSGYVSLYKVIERQGQLLGQKPGTAVVIASSLSSPSSECKARPPTHATNSHPLSVTSNTKTKEKPAQNHARTTLSEQNEKTKKEWERRDRARIKRLAVMAATAYELRVGQGPQPMSGRELEARRAELRRQAQQIVAAG